MKDNVRIAVLVGLLGCDRIIPMTPMVKISIEKNGSAYDVLFANCVDPAKPVGIHAIKVQRVQSRRDHYGHLCCSIVEMPGAKEITKRWAYGTAPQGYGGSPCEPLRSREMYRISVAGAGGGYAVFSTDGDGGVKLEEGGCK